MFSPTHLLRFLTRVEEDEAMYVRGWLKNNKLMGPVETTKPRWPTPAVSSSSSSGQGLGSKKGLGQTQGQGLGLTQLLRAHQQVYGTTAEVRLYFEEYRDMMMMAACPPLHLYGARGLKRYNQHTLSTTNKIALDTTHNTPSAIINNTPLPNTHPPTERTPPYYS